MSHLLLLFVKTFCCLTLFSHQIIGLALAPSPSPSPSSSNQNLSNSLHVAISAAMNEAASALDHVKLMRSMSSTVGERAAFSDCSEFYELTVTRLNQTLNREPYSTSFDVQIWLSTALTNLDNCRTSISEQNVMRPVFLDNNAPDLIRTSLAINGRMMKETKGQELRRWIPDGDVTELERATTNVIVVAQDGTGNCRTIKEALVAYRSRRSKGRVVIKVKQGTYHENLEISREMKDVMLVGDGIRKTIITGDRSARSGFSTLESATVKVMGDGFIARDMTFRNTAGPDGGQAVAFLSSSDRSAYYRCSFEGYQDTLWVNSNRQFYEECHIYGSIDFIFGNAAVVIQNSLIYARPPHRGQQVVITAQGRTQRNQPTGISIINCKFQPDPDQSEVLIRHFRAYLGRPWRDYARVVFLRTYLDGMVDPRGWMDWNGNGNGDARGNTVFYGEYGNYGPGSPTGRRVGWPGVRVLSDEREAKEFCVANFIGGMQWLPITGVPFSAGISL